MILLSGNMKPGRPVFRNLTWSDLSWHPRAYPQTERNILLALIRSNYDLNADGYEQMQIIPL